MAGAVRGGPLLRLIRPRRSRGALLRRRGGGDVPPVAVGRVPGQRRERRVPRDAYLRGAGGTLAVGRSSPEPYRGCPLVLGPLISRPTGTPIDRKEEAHAEEPRRQDGATGTNTEAPFRD